MDANLKCKTLSACRVYLAKRSTDKAVFKVLHSLKEFSTSLIEWPGFEFFLPTDRQIDRQHHATTDRHDWSLYPAINAAVMI